MLTLDVKSAIKDFETYDKKVKARMSKTLTRTAVAMSREQYRWLRQRVKKWTGKLGGSISAKRVGKYTYEIGPNAARVIYAWFIEAGYGTFAGYHYVQRSVNKYQKKFIDALKKDIDG